MYILRAKHGIAQSRGCPAQTWIHGLFAQSQDCPYIFLTESIVSCAFIYNEGTRVVSTTPEPGRAVERTHRCTYFSSLKKKKLRRILYIVTPLC